MTVRGSQANRLIRRPRGSRAIRTEPETIHSSRRVVWVIGTPAVSVNSRYSDPVVVSACSRVAMMSSREFREKPKSPDIDHVSKPD